MLSSLGAWTPTGAAEPSTPGYLDLDLATHFIDGPLFGSSSSGRYRLLWSQRLPAGENLSSWFSSGFPNYVADFGVEATGIRAGAALLAVGAGDVVVGSLTPSKFEPMGWEDYAIRGAAVRLEGERARWSFFTGAPKYPGSEGLEDPWLSGFRLLSNVGTYHLGVSFTAVQDAPSPDPGRGGGVSSIVGSEAFRELGPDAHLFGEILATTDGDAGFRAGAQLRFPRGDVTTSAYSFGEGFPDLVPLYRPGERGISCAGHFRPGVQWEAFGSVEYFADELKAEDQRVRGRAGLGWIPGAGLPSIQLSYERSTRSFDSTSIAAPATEADRLRLFVTHSRASEHLSASLERVTEDRSGQPDRSQGLVLYRRVLGFQSILSGSLLAQRSGGRDAGVTVETALERPLIGPVYWLAGLGGTYVDRAGAESGEGVLRLGLSHQPSRRRWDGRLELRLPFDVGLERPPASYRGLVVSAGTRFAWKDLDTLRDRLLPGSPSGVGQIEGRVSLEGEGVRGLRVLVDGESRAVTDGGGRFRIPRVEAGTAVVTLDIRALDPRYVVREGFSREVSLAAGSTARLDFTIAPASYFQGSVVTCDEERLVPLPRARLILRGAGSERTLTTSTLGDFQFDDLPPGPYVLIVELPPEAPVQMAGPATFNLDLRQDLPGHVIRIGCEDAP